MRTHRSFLIGLFGVAVGLAFGFGLGFDLGDRLGALSVVRTVATPVLSAHERFLACSVTDPDPTPEDFEEFLTQWTFHRMRAAEPGWGVP
jgi:hypothetical protein